MKDIATIEIDADNKTIRATMPEWQLHTLSTVHVPRSELIAVIIMAQAHELMGMTRRQLMERHLKILGGE